MTSKPERVQEESLSWDRHGTIVIIVMNVAVFLYSFWLKQGSPLQYTYFTLRYSLSLNGLQHGAWWQLITFQFLHGGWIHIGLNLLLLHSIGPVLETTIGRGRYVALYLISGSLGGLVHLVGAWSNPALFGHPVVGASAGICGVLAALSALYAEEEVKVYLFLLIPLKLRAKFLLLIVGLLSVAGVIFSNGTIRIPKWGWEIPLGNVAHLAHLGGFVGGLWCVNLFNVKPLPPLPENPPSDENPH
ncbi:MAG TPA: rhomboid family intramembrane serine protease [Candidatus Limnocylindria bacterium]|jgi:membrane associated rhomboid family serine protease|nr:rhomboid family intramembrane serine protease [Candidatus Limnocylindria bacterium]